MGAAPVPSALKLSRDALILPAGAPLPVCPGGGVVRKSELVGTALRSATANFCVDQVGERRPVLQEVLDRLDKLAPALYTIALRVNSTDFQS